FDKGYFFEPTIFDRVDNRMKIAQEEIFGPVLSVIPFKDADEALRIANDTMYGLAAAVWTKDIDRAFKFAKGIQAGTVWINCFHTAGIPQMPFGGYKQSGIGRELGQEGLELFLETKSVSIKLS
ncbi:MAG: aldehyde dehydrogenase family protein, partial [Chloroflexi bacterium]|nr:aldehyde dehydrogenase family protein [Chloroflexota bacterium]